MKFRSPVKRRKLAMVLINKQPKLSCHIASMQVKGTLTKFLAEKVYKILFQSRVNRHFRGIINFMIKVILIYLLVMQ